MIMIPGNMGIPAWTGRLNQMDPEVVPSHLNHPVIVWLNQYLKQQLQSHKMTEQMNCISGLEAVQSPLAVNLWWMSLCLEYFTSTMRIIRKLFFINKVTQVVDFSCFLYNSDWVNLQTGLKPAFHLVQHKTRHVNIPPGRWNSKRFTATLHLLVTTWEENKIKPNILTRLFETGKAYFIRFSNMDRLVLPSGLWANLKFLMS